jgi:hypothetical protein
MNRLVHVLSLAALLAPTPAWAAPEDRKLAGAAYAFLKKYCADCHSGPKPKSEVEDLDVLRYESLTKKITVDGEDYYYVKSGKKGDATLLKASLVWKKGGITGVGGAVTNMPPVKFDGKDVKNRPTDKERLALQHWIEAGAPKEGFGPVAAAKSGAAAVSLSRPAAYDKDSGAARSPSMTRGRSSCAAPGDAAFFRMPQEASCPLSCPCRPRTVGRTLLPPSSSPRPFSRWLANSSTRWPRSSTSIPASSSA